MRDAFFRELARLGEIDTRIMLLVGDLGYKLFDDFGERCPGRLLNMGVSEANMVSVAAGLALDGMRPVTYSIVPFATVRCLEQIRNDVCNMQVPVVVVGVGGGYAYGVNGATHHGVDDIGVLRPLPGITIFCPCDPNETISCLQSALELDGPAYLRLGRNKEPDLTTGCAPFCLGAPTVLRDGRKIALLACGPIAKECLDVADRLAQVGHEPMVLSAHTVKPIDGLSAFLRSSGFSHVFVVEEHGPYGGLAEAVAYEMINLPSRPNVLRISAPDRFFHRVGTQEFMRQKAGIDAGSIFERVTHALATYP